MAKKTRSADQAPPGPHTSPLVNGTMVVRLRKAKNWSQQDLADRAGVSRSTICRLELGGRPYGRPSTHLGVANALGITLEALYTQDAAA